MNSTLVFDRVWKRFRRGQVHDSLREVIPAMVRRFSGKKRPELEERDFWALSDVSFEVNPGEVLGIIGGNGAGKSTTLKILNQLMEPTHGKVHTRGKIGSLIEVSAGFHQDLTGRQNVYLQGAIMGMRKAEVKAKFDQIVEFAGIADFIDTPVKRYSSGMNARLGFSIAAHLEPDVLIIDEVLAVGDHAFQQRAFGKIKKLATGGIPVVLVSHQLDRIAELCTKVVLLEKGVIKTTGTAGHCIDYYIRPPNTDQLAEQSVEAGVRLDSMHLLTTGGVFSGSPVSLLLKGVFERETYPHAWQLKLQVLNADNGVEQHAFLCGWRGVSLPIASRFEHQIDLQMNLPPANYLLVLQLYDSETHQVLLAGPRVELELLERNKHWGPAQLNSRWTVVHLSQVDSAGLIDRAATPEAEAPEAAMPAEMELLVREGELASARG